MTTISKKDMFDNPEWKTGIFDDKPDPELTRVEAILKPILSHLDDDAKIGYHFGENNGHDEKHFEEFFKDLPVDTDGRCLKWRTIYDSSYFPVSDGGSYSAIDVADVPSGDLYYLGVSLGGSIGASALTEFYKVPVNGKWAWSA